MSKWVIRKPPSINDRHERFLIRIGIEREPETTPIAILALRFDTARAAHVFAAHFDGALDEWRVVRR